MSVGFDPLYKWLGIPPDEQPPNCYRLLGLCIYEDNADAIQSAADRQMAYLRTFQTGPQVRIAQELLNQVATAKVWLLNPEKKAQYDAWLRQQVGSTSAAVPPVAGLQAAAQEALPDFRDVLGDVTAEYAPSGARIKRKPRPSWLVVGFSMLAAIGAMVGIGILAVWKFQDAPQDNRVAVNSEEQTAVRLPQPKAGERPERIKAKQPEKKDERTVEKPGSEKVNGGEFTLDKSKKEQEGDLGESAMESESGAKVKKKTEESAEETPADNKRPSPKAEEFQRLDVPDETAQRTARQTVAEVYKLANAKSVSDKQALTKRLLQEAIQTRNDPVGQFVLLRTTEELALECGDGLTAFSAIEEMAQRYKVDAIGRKSQILDSFAKKARLPEQHKSLADEALRLADAAVAEGRLPVAVQLAKLATREASKAHDRGTVQRTRARAKELEEIGAAYEEVMAATAVLAEKPQDPEANLSVGKYHCFFRGDWDSGLPLLARGSDAGLKALARRDLEGASAPEIQTALADEWRDSAAKANGLARRQQQARAAYWYRKALPGLSGLAKAAAERWLKEFGALPIEGESR